MESQRDKGKLNRMADMVNLSMECQALVMDFNRELSWFYEQYGDKYSFKGISIDVLHHKLDFRAVGSFGKPLGFNFK